jgi:hypothetical protein
MEYGTDITFDGNDITPGLTITKDSSVVLEALSLRLQTNYGALWYDPEYGFNVMGLLKSPIHLTNGLSTIKTRIENECYKDSRVDTVEVQTRGDVRNMTLIVKVKLVNGETNDLVFDLNTTDLATKNI